MVSDCVNIDPVLYNIQHGYDAVSVDFHRISHIKKELNSPVHTKKKSIAIFTPKQKKVSISVLRLSFE